MIKLNTAMTKGIPNSIKINFFNNYLLYRMQQKEVIHKELQNLAPQQFSKLMVHLNSLEVLLHSKWGILFPYNLKGNLWLCCYQQE